MMSERKSCFICNNSKCRITRIVNRSLYIDICEDCEKRIEEGKDEDYSNCYHALFDLGLPIE